MTRPSRSKSTDRLTTLDGVGSGLRSRVSGWTDQQFDELEAHFREGISVQQVVDAFAGRGERLTEATFRKYVQLGLLPRSVRVGRKGKHRGSQGLYPASIVRQLDLIRRLMSQGFTIEEIQQEFLFARVDIAALTRQLEQVFTGFEQTMKKSSDSLDDPLSARALSEARVLAGELVVKLEMIESRLSARARMARAAV